MANRLLSGRWFEEVLTRPSPDGGSGRAHIVAAASDNATLVKAGPGQVRGWCLANTTGVWQYVKLHDRVSLPVAGADVAMTIGIPPNDNSVIALEDGVRFNAGLGYTIVTGAADNSAVATTLNAVVGDLFWA